MIRKFFFEETRSGQSPSESLWRSEEGSITFSSVVVVLGMVVLIAFCGNISSEALRKQRLQTAADSIAYSNAVWAARGMNTISIINHAMGELTSFCVIFDALGGPHVKMGSQERQGENFPKFKFGPQGLKLYKDINAWSNKKTLVTCSVPILGVADDLVINAFFKMFEAIYDDKKTNECSGAIYDAKVTLLYYANRIFTIKSTATIIERVGQALGATGFLSPVGAVLQIVGVAIHFYATFILARIFFEMPTLRLLETLLPVISPPIQSAIYPFLPIFTEYSKFVAEKDITPGNTWIHLSNDSLKKAYQLRTLEVYPGTKLLQKKFLLPVQREALPPQSHKLSWRSISYDDSTWKGNDIQNTSVSNLDKAETALDTVEWIIRPVKIALAIISWFDDEASDAEDLLDSIPSITPARKPDAKGIKENLAFTEFNTFRFDVAYEARSQWVRATAPPLDSARLKFRKALAGLLPASNISTYFTHWTNRYILEESYNIRNGKYTEGKEAFMYIMEGSDPLMKGNEQWVRNPDMADSMFSFIVAVESKAQKPAFSPEVFQRSGPKSGDIVIAQAVFYNATGRKTEGDGRLKQDQNLQPQTGWDTLQWNPETLPGECFAPPNPESLSSSQTTFSTTHMKKTFRHFYQRSPFEEHAKIKLNWEAKLAPITNNSLKRLQDSTKHQSIKQTCEFMLKYDMMITH